MTNPPPTLCWFLVGHYGIQTSKSSNIFKFFQKITNTEKNINTIYTDMYVILDRQSCLRRQPVSSCYYTKTSNCFQDFAAQNVFGIHKNFRIFLSHEKNKMQNLGDFHNFFRQWLPGTGYRSCPFWWIIQLDIEDNSAPLKGEHIFSQAHTFMTTTL